MSRDKALDNHPDSTGANTTSNPYHWFVSNLTEKNCVMVLIVLFIMLSVFIASFDYDPEVDKADATTNDIWVEYYSEGIYHVSIDEWDHIPTQSVVVEHDDGVVVVNEKGPGHVVLLLPFYMLGVDFLFGPFMVALAVIATYMLGKRLANWRTGFIASALVMTNVTVLVMSYRSYWTDASTMHLLVLSIWLLIESIYWFNGKSLDPGSENVSNAKQRLFGLFIGILSGLTFGLSVSTRYATALIIIALALYVCIFYLIRAWPDLKRKRFKYALKRTDTLWLVAIAFSVGLMLVLVPLIQYNNEYFGGPFRSGYDALEVNKYDPDTQVIAARNTSAGWSQNFGDMVSYALKNLGALFPLFIARMPGLIFLPIGIWILRKRPELVLLLSWLIINFFTYLSIVWVDMYATLPPQALHEPRYWMPSIPVVALFAGFGIDRLSRRMTGIEGSKNNNTRDKRKFTTFIITLIVLVALVLWCVIPTANYLDNLGPGGAEGPGRKQPLPNVIIVNTDKLVDDPYRFQDQFVLVENAEVIAEKNVTIVIRSIDARLTEGVPVRFDSWPRDEIPAVNIGDRVDVMGIFVIRPFPDQSDQFFINVKYNTKDYFRILK
jgi:hypothetical protein